MSSNFLAYLRDANDHVIRDSVRRGHNVFTENGKEWFTHLLAWRTLSMLTGDTSFTNWRVRWMGVGDGVNPMISSVEALQSSLPITTGPDVYLGEVFSPPEFPTSVSVRVARTFGPAELGAVTITEAGLFVGSSPGVNGALASIEDRGGWIFVAGLTDMHPQVEGRVLNVTSGDNVGSWKITKYINETTVIVDIPAPSLPDSGNPNIAWELVTDVGDIESKPVAYKSFEGLVKIPGFSLEIEWDFRF